MIQEGAKTLNPTQMEYFMTDLQQKNIRLVRRVPKAHAILGFIRFLKGYYLVLVTKRKRVGKISYHSIYQVYKTEMVPLFEAADNTNRDDEIFYMNMF